MKKHLALAAAYFAAATVCGIVLSNAENDAAAKLARGKYLASIMDCGGCHTPGALAGQPDHEKPFSGSDVGFRLPGLGTFYPPNLTSDEHDGLGRWSVQQIAKAVRTGERPDGRILAPIMPYKNYAALNDDDATALASYLKSLPAVSHKVPGPFGDSEQPTSGYLAMVEPKRP